MTPRAKYLFKDHTAEIGIEMEAPGWKGFFRTAAEALKKLILEKPPKTQAGKPTQETIHLKAGDMEQLLVAWINEIIFWIHTKRFIPEKYNLSVDEERHALTANIRGRRFAQLSCKLEVKSATYHGLKIKSQKNKVRATVILDV